MSNRLLEDLLDLPVIASPRVPEGNAFLVERTAFDGFMNRWGGCPEPARRRTPFEKLLFDCFDGLTPATKVELKFHKDAFALRMPTLTGTVKMATKELIGYGVRCPRVLAAGQHAYFGGNLADEEPYWSGNIADLHVFPTVQALLAYYNTHPAKGGDSVAGFIAPGTTYEIGKVYREGSEVYIALVDDQYLMQTPGGHVRHWDVRNARRFASRQAAWDVIRMCPTPADDTEIIAETGGTATVFEAVA